MPVEGRGSGVRSWARGVIAAALVGVVVVNARPAHAEVLVVDSPALHDPSSMVKPPTMPQPGPRPMPPPHRIPRLPPPPPPLPLRVVRADLAEQRRAALAFVHRYRLAGAFAHNTFAATAVQLWRDRDGRWDVVAGWMSESIGAELTQRIADQDNFMHIADVTDGPIADWILTSGFTREELARLQFVLAPVAKVGAADDPAAPIQIDDRLRQAADKQVAAALTRLERQLRAGTAASLKVQAGRLIKHDSVARSFFNAMAAKKLSGSR